MAEATGREDREDKIACLHELLAKGVRIIANLQDVHVEDNLSELEALFEALKERRVELFKTQQKVCRVCSLLPAVMLRKLGCQRVEASRC